MNMTRTQSTMRPAVLSWVTRQVLSRWSASVLGVIVLLCGIGNIDAHADTFETQKLVFQFQDARAQKLVLHQPDLVAFLSGAGTGVLNANITDQRGTVTFSSGVDRRIWARLNGRWGETGARKDKYGFGAMGLHAYVRPHLIVGGIVEADYFSQAGSLSGKEGGGTMAGSYFLARHANHPVFFEGRLLYGRSSDRIRLSGSTTERLNTRRVLAQLKMSGQRRYGATTLTQSLLVSHAADDLTPRTGGSLSGQGIRLGQVKMGLGFRHTLGQMNGGPFVLSGGGALTGTSTRRHGSGPLTMPHHHNKRGRLDLGVRYRTQAGGAVAINSFIDGLGASVPQNYGVKAAFGIRF